MMRCLHNECSDHCKVYNHKHPHKHMDQCDVACHYSGYVCVDKNGREFNGKMQ